MVFKHKRDFVDTVITYAFILNKTYHCQVTIDTSCFRFTTAGGHNSLLITHNSQFTIHYSQFTTPVRLASAGRAQLTTHDSRFTIHDSRSHSLLKLFTGFATAALIAWKLTVASVINKAPDPAMINIHQDMVVL